MSQATRPPEAGEFGLASWLQAGPGTTQRTVIPPCRLHSRKLSHRAQIPDGDIHMYRRDTLVVHGGYETITRVVVRDGDMTRKERDDD